MGVRESVDERNSGSGWVREIDGESVCTRKSARVRYVREYI